MYAIRSYYALPTLTPDNFQNESNFPRYCREIYANFIPCNPNFIIIAIIAIANGIIPIATTSSILISN